MNNFRTLLGVGPVSKNVIDVTIYLSNQYDIPISLIPSRRQIDRNGGYVGLTTKEFAKYVREKDKGGKIILSRDHGGPWQGEGEIDLEHKEAMIQAKLSYEEDIQSGFDVLHIDPSLKYRQLALVKKDIIDLYHHLNTVSAHNKKCVCFEVGTEECGGLTDPVVFENFVKEMKDLSKVQYIVGNTGTLVKEMRQVGNFDAQRAKELVDICNKYDIIFKEHNLDYSDESVFELHPQLGIHSANVAPQYGTLETNVLLSELFCHGMETEYWNFIHIATQSGKWKKWLVDDTFEHNQKYLAQICGHYIFNHPDVLEIKAQAQRRFDLESILKSAIYAVMYDHLYCFGWINE